MTAHFLTLHALHALPPSLINRDDNNAAKTVTMGGVRRLRVSSQAWKRAIRVHMRANAIDGGAYGLRTVKFPALTADILAQDYQRDLDAARAKTALAFTAVGFATREKSGGTSISIFASEQLPARVAAAINTHWDAITQAAPLDDPTADVDAAAATAATGVPEEVLDTIVAALDIDNTIDLALFGRMLAATGRIASQRVDGAVAVDHATSVHEAAIESDFFTAVDDAATADDAAVAFQLGASSLAAPLLYRSLSIDRRQLRRNLAAAADPEQLAADAEAAVVDAFIRAMPAAKKNSTNSATLPSVVVAIAGDHALSLANAFHTPLTGPSMLATAVERLTAQARVITVVEPDAHLAALVLDPALEVEGIDTVTSPRQLLDTTTA